MRTNPTPNLDYNLWIIAKACKAVIAAVIVIICAIAILNQFGCTYNRNAPLLNIQDSANGNTVPLVGQ